MTISLIANEIISGLGSPSDLSDSFVSFWLRTNVGKLNLALDSSFVLSGSTGLSPAIEEDQKIIWEKMFDSYYWGKKVADNLGAVGTNTALEVSENGFTAKMVNKNEVSKTYLTFKKDTDVELNGLVDAYKRNKYAPVQVVGDDNVAWDARPTTKETNRT